MPYRIGQKWKAQVRKKIGETEHRKEKSFASKKEALEWEAEMRRKPVEEWKAKTDTVCLADWAQMYLDFAEATFSRKTYEEKKSLFRRFFKEVDPTLSIEELNKPKVLAYIMKQEEDRSGNAANKDRKNLVAAWNWGVEYLDPPLPSPNPCLVKRMPEVRHPRYIPPEKDFWQVYGVAQGQDKIMLLTFLHLAARRGEIFRLAVPDLDFDNSRLRLWTRKRKDGNFEYDWLPMTKELRDALLWWLKKRPIKDSPYVFLCLDDTPFCREDYGKPFRYRLQFMRRLCDKAGVKRFGFHAIRHLSAIILYKLGYGVNTIQLILRHKSPRTTELYLKNLGLGVAKDALNELSRRREGAQFREEWTGDSHGLDAKKKPSGEPPTPQTARAKLRVIK